MNSDKESTQQEDNQVLLEGAVNDKTTGIHSKYLFLITKSISFLIYLLSIILNFHPLITIFLNLLVGFIDFWLCKNEFGLKLVGLQWYLDSGTNGNSKWVFYSRPDPYIPDPVDVNIFWGCLYSFTFLWLLLIILTLVSRKYSGSVASLLLFVINIFNVICFKRCEIVQSHQADEVARTIMLGDEFSSDKLDLEEEVAEAIPEIEASEEEQKIKLKLPEQNSKED